MTHAQFWKTAFEHLVDYAASDRIAAWRTDAAAFLPARDPGIDERLGYYLGMLRSGDRDRFCSPLK